MQFRFSPGQGSGSSSVAVPKPTATNITFRVLLKVARGLNVPLSELISIYERNRREP